LDAYKEFEKRVGDTASPRGAKTGLLLGAIDRQGGVFLATDLQKECPGVGLDLILRVLNRFRKAGKLDCEVRGPKSLWHKTDTWIYAIRRYLCTDLCTNLAPTPPARFALAGQGTRSTPRSVNR